MNFFVSLYNHITFQQVEVVLLTTLKIVLIMIFMFIGIKLGNIIIDRFIEKQSKLKFSIEEKKSKTIGTIIKSIMRYSIFFLGIIEILSLLFSGISLTFAGIGGVAIGFGAQDVLKDIISGFFILMEDQFTIGEYVTLEDKSGLIESMELRITKIRDFNGDIHTIPNRLISKVTNHSRGDKRVMLDVEISNGENVDKVISILDRICDNYNKTSNSIIEGTSVLGVSAMKENSFTIKIVGRAINMTQGDCEMQLRREIVRSLENEKIKAITSKVDVTNNISR
ncbi:MAG TPA: mechanosensitive ion channel domain-containing protein [Clostridiaceae bacterium]